MEDDWGAFTTAKPKKKGKKGAFEPEPVAPPVETIAAPEANMDDDWGFTGAKSKKKGGKKGKVRSTFHFWCTTSHCGGGVMVTITCNCDTPELHVTVVKSQLLTNTFSGTRRKHVSMFHDQIFATNESRDIPRRRCQESRKLRPPQSYAGLHAQHRR